MSLKNLSAKNKIPKLLNSKLNNKKINLIYKRFEKSLNINDNFIVAVSGGPDSLALAFLAKIYSIKKKLFSKFYIVDHKLRPESTKEAKDVKKILHQHSINADILTWQGKKPSNIAFGGHDGRTVYVTLQDRGYIETFRTRFPGRSFNNFDE